MYYAHCNKITSISIYLRVVANVRGCTRPSSTSEMKYNQLILVNLNTSSCW